MEATSTITATTSSSSIITPLPSPRDEVVQVAPTPSPSGRLPRPPPSPSTPTTSNPVNQSQIYIVQVPKDQIYRVPPPENEAIAERHRTNHENKRKKRNPCLSFFCWLLAGLLLVGITIILSSILFFVIVHPGVPSFTIDRLLVTCPNQHMVYNFTMKSKNPSNRLGFSYERGGKVMLAYEGEELARGGTPEFYQKFKKVMELQLVLNGLNIPLPKNIKRSLNGSKEVLPLSLSISYPVRLKISELRLWEMRIAVKCDVKASRLGKGAQLVSQKCKAKLHV